MSEKVLESNDKSKRIADIKKRRTEKLSAFDIAAKATREDSEIKLGEIEERTGKTFGIDLAAMFLPDGRLIAIKKPATVVHNKLMIAQGNGKVTDEVITEYCNAALEFPETPIELEKIFLIYANAREAVVNAGILLHSVDQSNLLGK
jgi:hypothetical protein